LIIPTEFIFIDNLTVSVNFASDKIRSTVVIGVTDLDVQNASTPHHTNQPMDTLVHAQPQETQQPITNNTSAAANKVLLLFSQSLSVSCAIVLADLTSFLVLFHFLIWIFCGDEWRCLFSSV